MDTKLLLRINDVLKGFPEYWTNEGELHKPRVIDDIRDYRSELLGALLSDELIKEIYGIDINGSYVFKQSEFIDFFRYKSYWDSSYTRFSNEIGLTSEGKYLKYNSDVVLDFPYKDTVLEGGMTKEDVGKQEVYYHNIIAKEEIDILLSQKVLCNAKKIDKNGENVVDRFSQDDNLILKGNNLLALHSLKKRFAGKAALIYIDVPYNTEGDSFKYNDRFNHSTWLTFMKNRLEVSKDLLKNNGLLFIHIGDQELHYLKVMCDSVFGREHFLATVPRKTRSGKSDVPYKLSQDYDWLLIYTKEATRDEKLFQREIERKYYRSDDFPDDEWRLSDLTKQTSIKERPKSNFTLVNPRNGDEYPVNPNRSWAITTDTVDGYLKKKKIVFPGDYDFLNIKNPYMRIFKSEEIEKYGEDFNKTYVSTEFINKTMDIILKDTVNKKGTDEIVALFKEKVFSYPKNELLIQKIIEYCTKEKDLVIDFFLGSGTTTAVAHKMGRQYIGIEQMEYINDVTVERMKKVIAGEQGGISQDVQWNGGGTFIYAELMSLNEKFKQKINGVSTLSELEEVIDIVKEHAYLNFRVDLERLTTKNNDFNRLTLSEQKLALIQALDENQSYVAYSEIDDTEFDIDKTTKAFNHSFYQSEKKEDNDE
jgi:adenine-specific DNA-methyltransferase